jgi:flagellar biosynthesis/type III secretory pathway protein FliH
MDSTDLAVKLEMQRQADAAMERVKAMCRRAFEDGLRQGAQQGYQQGFNDGVLAMGPPPAIKPINSDAKTPV